MKDKSEIAWTDYTFNPWEGCTKVSPGCQNCYACEDRDHRWKTVTWGPKGARRRVTSTLTESFRWQQEAIRTGQRLKVFSGSLCDIFDDHPSIEREWRDDLWKKVRETPCLQWLLLTKRPENIVRFLPPDWNEGYPNACLLVSVENQELADKRIPMLLEVPAASYGLSCEPLLGPVDLTAWLPRLDWVIAGGESGTGARPMHPNWARGLRDQCRIHDTPFFFKQWGCWAPAA